VRCVRVTAWNTWAYHPDCKDDRLDRILKARSIPGVVLAAVKGEELALDWDAYAVAYAGQMIQSLVPFHACGADYYDAAVTAMRHAAGGGCTKVGLLLTESEDRYSGGRYLAGFLRERERAESMLSGDVSVFSPKRDFRVEDMRRWLVRQQPDVVVVADDFLAEWLQTKRPPGMCFRTIVLEKLRIDSPFGGVRIPYAEIGAGSVDLIVEQLHCGERGLPANPKVVLRRTWWDEATESVSNAAVAAVE